MIDSLRETDEKGSHPVNRSRYFAVQTPQVFCSELLLKAYGQEFSALLRMMHLSWKRWGKSFTWLPETGRI